MSSSNNNNQQVEQTEITVASSVVTQGTRNMRDDQTIGFLLGCAKRGRNRGNQDPPTICKVSKVLRDHSESSFTPQLVSIGPIHREDPKLKEFEWLKECYLHDLLHREDPKLLEFEWLKEIGSTPEETLEECLLEVNKLIPRIRESYAGVKKNYSDDEVARMMVMDGCFILEFCFKQEEDSMPNKMQNSRIAMDLLLLENQVPFFVLQALFDCIIGKHFFNTLSSVLDICLARYIMIFSSCSSLAEFSTTDVDSGSPHDTRYAYSNSTHYHILGYLHKCFQHPIHTQISKPVAAKSSKCIHTLKSKLVAAKSWNLIHALQLKLLAAKSWNLIHALKLKLVASKSWNLIHARISKLVDKKGSKNTRRAFHSIVDLDRSGINFKPHQQGGWSMTIKFQPSPFACLPWFWSKPTLLMPILDIHDFTELILRNLIAYEQSFPKLNRYYFTSYARVMDTLINTCWINEMLLSLKYCYDKINNSWLFEKL